jgi:hypothetical protein
MICRVKLDEKKSKYAGLALGNGVGLSVIEQFTVAGKMCSNVVHLEKRV